MSRISTIQKSRQSRFRPLPKRTLEPIEENSDSMEIEDSPVKGTRRRASTMGYQSPNTKPQFDILNRPTTDTYKRFYFYNNDEDRDHHTISSQMHFDNTLKKVRELRFVDFLKKHEITEKFRAKMIDWMIEVLNTYKQKESTLYRAIFIMDYYYSCLNVTQTADDLHLTGIVCMMIASKSEEVKFIKTDVFLDTIGRKRFTKDDLLRKELEILKVIKFKACFPSTYDLIMCCFQILDLKDIALKTFIEKCVLTLTKMCLLSYELLNSLPLTEVTLYCLVLALKMSEKVKKIDLTSLVI